MTKPQRFATRYVNGAHVRIEPDPNGKYVSYEDYAALEAERDALREALEYVRDWAKTTSPELLSNIAEKALANGGGG